MDGLDVGIAVLDSDTRIVAFNRWLERTSGYAAEEVRGQLWGVVFPSWVQPPLSRALDAVFTSGQPVVVARALDPAPLPLHWDEQARRNGARIAQSVKLLPIVAETGSYCLLQVIDVSDETLREQRLSELATRAQESRNAQRQFLARMSHEIRTPMNGVIALCELLLLSNLDAEQRETLEVIHDSSHSLLGIINDVLDFSKIDAGKMTINKSACDVRSTVKAVTALLGARAAEKKVRVRLRLDESLPEVVIVDELRTRQVLLNLIGNAIKFTDPEGQVEVVARWADEAGSTGTLTFAIEDSGIGIANPDDLFRVYAQADGTISQRFGGTGLGLAISKQLVELMGGQIAVRSTLGRGSTFWFTLPAEVTASTVLEVEPKSATVMRNTGKVLVVDDNRVNQLVAGKILTQMGYHVATADNGQRAVEMVGLGGYDVVFMDCQMPVMDGYQATRELRALGYTQLPIVAVTAAAVEGEREACFAAGMSDYLAKPLTLRAVSDLFERLRSNAA